MHCVKKINDDLYWVGGTDRRLALFENVYPIPRGVSYNAYMMMDEKTVLLDTVDQSVSGQFFGWLTGLGTQVRLAGPENVVEEYRNYLKKIYGRYEEGCSGQ